MRYLYVPRINTCLVKIVLHLMHYYECFKNIGFQPLPIMFKTYIIILYYFQFKLFK